MECAWWDPGLALSDPPLLTDISSRGHKGQKEMLGFYAFRAEFSLLFSALFFLPQVNHRIIRNPIESSPELHSDLYLQSHPARASGSKFA